MDFFYKKIDIMVMNFKNFKTNWNKMQIMVWIFKVFVETVKAKIWRDEIVVYIGFLSFAKFTWCMQILLWGESVVANGLVPRWWSENSEGAIWGFHQVVVVHWRGRCGKVSRGAKWWESVEGMGPTCHSKQCFWWGGVVAHLWEKFKVVLPENESTI